MLNFRRLFLIAFFVSIASIVTGYIIEYVLHIEPCPLCILQRLTFGAIAIALLIGILHDPQIDGYILKSIYSIFTAILGVVGILLSSRQIWLQHLPLHQIPDCTAGFNKLFEVYPFFEALKKLFESSGECAEVNFTMLGISLAEWSLGSFILITLLCLSFFLIKKRRI